jgi:hypothetical protein
MTDHPQIFGGPVSAHPPARARRSDPITSHIAAESMTPAALSKQRSLVLWAIVQLERHGGDGATTVDICVRLAYENNTVPQQSVVARRCTDLRDLGLIEDSGVTRIGTSKRPLIVWKSTAAGREAVPTREVA